MKTLNPALAKVLKRLHYPPEVILVCVRWYVAYPLSLRQLEEMMVERGIAVDHSTECIVRRSSCYPCWRRRSAAADARSAGAGEWTKHTSR